MKIPVRYVLSELTRADKQKQINMLLKSLHLNINECILLQLKLLQMQIP